MMKYHGYKRNDALAYLKTKRPIVQPNISNELKEKNIPLTMFCRK